MNDIISRQDAIEVLKEYEVVESDNFTRTDPISMMTVATIANCIEAIVELPSAEPERTAKVVHKSDTYVVTPPKTTTASYETRTNLWEECGNCHAMGIYHGWNYCPYCGARLDWSENE